MKKPEILSEIESTSKRPRGGVSTKKGHNALADIQNGSGKAFLDIVRARMMTKRGGKK